MVEKLIRGRIIEIIIVILLVLSSIPVWKSFENHISKAEITTLDDLNLEFNIKNNSNGEQLVVNNNYNFNKEYKIFFQVNKNINKENSFIKINGLVYKLEDFYCKTKRGNYIYTIINDNIASDSKSYLVEPIIQGNNINYSYIFEENAIF